MGLAIMTSVREGKMPQSSRKEWWSPSNSKLPWWLLLANADETAAAAAAAPSTTEAAPAAAASAAPGGLMGVFTGLFVGLVESKGDVDATTGAELVPPTRAWGFRTMGTFVVAVCSIPPLPPCCCCCCSSDGNEAPDREEEWAAP
jgi:hypothetical protein